MIRPGIRHLFRLTLHRRGEAEQDEDEEMRTRGAFERLGDIVQDFRYTLRSVGRMPGLAVAIVLTLGLGVGVNAAIFSVLDRVLFRAPPGVHKPSELHRLYWRAKIYGLPPQTRSGFSVP